MQPGVGWVLQNVEHLLLLVTSEGAEGSQPPQHPIRTQAELGVWLAVTSPPITSKPQHHGRLWLGNGDDLP